MALPYLKVESNQEVENKKDLIQKMSKFIAGELGKPESYVMVKLETDVNLSFGGSFDPAVFVELKSIGLPESKTGKLSGKICEFIEEELSVSQDRIYINFFDISGSNWGWNGSTF